MKYSFRHDSIDDLYITHNFSRFVITIKSSHVIMYEFTDFFSPLRFDIALPDLLIHHLELPKQSTHKTYILGIPRFWNIRQPLARRILHGGTYYTNVKISD